MGSYRRNYLKGNYKKVFICTYCGRPMTIKSMTVDHIIPKNLFKKIRAFTFLLGILSVIGGAATGKNTEGLIAGVGLFLFGSIMWEIKDLKWNLVPACISCNRKKSDKVNLKVLWAFLVKGGLGAIVSIALAIGIYYYMV